MTHCSATASLAFLLFLGHFVFAFDSASAGDSSPTIDFVNDVIPVLTKAGCNTGICHAKAGGGQNGFELSLLGFEPREDFDHLVREARGRRLFPAAPDQSLLLTKASGKVAHGGGVRLQSTSDGYELLREWIRQGTPLAGVANATLESIEVRPSSGKIEAGGQQQLTAVAHYSDGTQRDVTRLALFESNDPAMAEVSEQGRVRTMDIPGKVSVMVRYQGKVAVFGAAVPLGAPIDEIPDSNNFIEELVFANLMEIGIPPSRVCDDATFIRRVSLDLAGRLPTADETREFLGSEDPKRREQFVDALLRSPDYADYFANNWTALLKNRRDDASDITSNFAFHAWIRDSLLANVPYDQLVRELLAATIRSSQRRW